VSDRLPEGEPTRQGVRETYDRIGAHFATTRASPWPAVESFVERLAEGPGVGDLALDLGCGNGRHAELLAARAARVVGVDLSRAVLSVARDRARKRGYALATVQADATILPVAPRTVDAAVYVAAIHHLPDRAQRVGSLDELARVLAPGGRALVSAWATTHGRFADAGDDAVIGGNDGAVDSEDAAESDARNAAETGFDTAVDWTLPGGEAVPRYYHIYAPAEFAADVAASALTAERLFEERGNCYAEVSGPRRRETD
jgi:SAM-dependent methyltransferase